MKKIPIRHITTTISETINPAHFNIRLVKDLVKRGDLKHDLHRHDFFFVLALEKGKGIHEIDFIEYPIKDHTIFIIRPGQVHKLELKDTSTGFLMAFDASFYQPQQGIAGIRLKQATTKNYCQLKHDSLQRLYATLSRVFDEFSQKQEGYIETIKANLDIFFIEFLRQSRKSGNIPKSTGNHIQERFEELLSLLETNITEVKTVSEYARMLNLSAYQLNTITRTAIGKTTSDVINEHIILEAKRNLLATSNQVKDIAWNLGYEDVSYFIRLFKKHTGYSPELFRQNSR